MMRKILGAICKDWKIKLLGVSSDGARNMTGRNAGVVTHLASSMEASCEFIFILCEAHPVELVMEYVMFSVV